MMGREPLKGGEHSVERGLWITKIPFGFRKKGELESKYGVLKIYLIYK